MDDASTASTRPIHVAKRRRGLEVVPAQAARACRLQRRAALRRYLPPQALVIVDATMGNVRFGNGRMPVQALQAGSRAKSSSAQQGRL